MPIDDLVRSLLLVAMGASGSLALVLLESGWLHHGVERGTALSVLVVAASVIVVALWSRLREARPRASQLDALRELSWDRGQPE